MAKTVSLFEAYKAGYLRMTDEEEEITDELIRTEFEVWWTACVEGGGTPEPFHIVGNGDQDTDDEVLDLDLCYKVLNSTAQELVDLAHGGNLARRHHLESAVAYFEDIRVLIRAEQIIRTTLDPRDDPTA